MSLLVDDDDPFACFGSDDESGNESDDKIAFHNQTINISGLESTVNFNNADHISKQKTTGTEHSISDAYNNDDLPPSPSLPTPALWEDFKPLYMGPMHIAMTDKCGGGRGYVASRNLEPGTLLLVEQPIFTWPQDQIGKELGLQSILALFSGEGERLQDDDIRKIIWAIEELHPSKHDVSNALFSDSKESYTEGMNLQVDGMMKYLNRKYTEVETNKLDLDELVQLARTKNIYSSSNKMPIEETDIFRMLLVLRYNGFGSGLYLHFSIFNHHCDPNCIKFFPSTLSKQMTILETNRRYSEVRTTKYIKRGEQLTLHYLDPRETSHATRRKHLMEQHLFDIGVEPIIPRLKVMDYVKGCIPPSSITNILSSLQLNTSKAMENEDIDMHNRTSKVEKTIEDMEDLKLELSTTIEVLTKQNKLEINSSNRNIFVETFERITALEISSLELCHVSSTDILQNNQHILMIRCYRLHLDTIELLQKTLDQYLLSNEIITAVQQNKIVQRFTDSALRLLDLQRLLLGDHHPDVARTYLDLGNSINSLLSSSPKLLFNLGKESASNNFTSWAKKEAIYMKEYRRISKMYPMDTSDYISEK